MLSAFQNHTPSEHHNPSSTYTSSSSSSASSPYNYTQHSATASDLSPLKRLKIEHDFEDIPSTYDCPPLVYETSMPHSVPRGQPQINIQKASEPSTPVTVTSTLSSPSPSPSSVTILSDPQDFELFGDDSFPIQEQNTKFHSQRMGPIFSSNPSNTGPQGARYSSQHYNNADAPWYQMQLNYGKPPVQQHSFYNNGMNGYHNDPQALARAQHGLYQQHSQHHGEDDIPELSPCHSSHMSTSGRPSISETDMPVTPVRSPVRGDSYNHHTHQGPKLQRTISDAVQDELFNPGIAPGTTHTSSGNHSRQSSQSSQQFNGIFQQAQNQHALAAARANQSVPFVAARDTSPFRANSPFHPARTHEPTQSPTSATSFLPVGAYSSARGLREMQKQREAEALKLQMQKDYEECQKAPKTISPKDAYITEFAEPDGDGVHGSLFDSSQQESYSSGASISDAASPASYQDSLPEDDIKTEASYGSMATSRRPSGAAVPMDYAIPMYQQQQYNQQMLDAAAYGWSTERSSQESSAYEHRSPMYPRPEETSANSGAYSCTVHGCPMRFPTASKMSKHRREAHRHGTPLNRDAIIRSQHQGPHRCMRINPTTNKPCNVIFSRPYDLTRHEDTIHNTARPKARCEICNDDKTFSRYDALTRHKKVKHGIDK